MISRKRISIHAPAWGATLSRCIKPPYSNNFNPRTRVGCDSFLFVMVNLKFYFNPRTRVGCDGITHSMQVIV